MKPSFHSLGLILPVAASFGQIVAADDGAGAAFFETSIRPVLVKHCYECHSDEAGKSKGGLLLDSKHGIRIGGDSGPAVVPGQPGESLLLKAVSHTDPDLKMPPRKPQLPKSVIGDIERWIAMGAPDPREASGKTVQRPPVDIESGRKFWAYQKPASPKLPAIRNADWPKRDLDRFVLAKLEENQIAPSPDAEPVTFLRRLSFDLIGLPPTPEEATAFVEAWREAAANPSSSANLETLLAATADRLLASPRFGERWGRHWLDVVRFAESNGRESNLTYPHAWRYRDYVIDAVNEDRPFDRFVVEQIAGDLLPAKNDAERARLLIATGFLAFGAKGLNEMNHAQFEADVADEQIDAVTRAVLASSVACARCHDHKSDPFSMEDYYALAGIFKSTKTCFGTWVDSENNNAGDLIRLPELPGQLIPNKPISAQRVAQLKADLAKLNREEREQKAVAIKAAITGKDMSDKAFEMLKNAIRIYWTRGGIEGQLKTVDDSGRALPMCMGVIEKDKIRDSFVFERGEIAHPVKPVARGFPRVLELSDARQPAKAQSGRLELAQWLTSRDHPLTARVMANRVWRHLFGSGIVRTVDNFGFSGERPSHPELLDHLAVKFVDGGWSVKSLVREIVLSRSYRQSSAFRPDCFERDPDNRMLWRTNKRRLDAEVIRDSMLAVSGKLDTSRLPGSLIANLAGQSVSLLGFNKEVPPDFDGTLRRSVYLPVVRDHLPDALELFDFAEPSLVTGSRDVTNVPLQALYLMNGAFVQGQADALADRVMNERMDEAGRIRRAFTLCFNRVPDHKEIALARGYFEAARRAAESAPGEERKIWSGYCQSLLSTAEFRNMD